MTKIEIASLNDKVYHLALSNSRDSENISRMIKLLLQQHDSQTELVFETVISLGSPFDNYIKKIFCNQLKENINTTYSGSGLTFQQKARKYFVPEFSGLEYEIFSEFLMTKMNFCQRSTTKLIQQSKVTKYSNEKNYRKPKN